MPDPSAPVPIAFNPSDPLQQKFLSALALGESGTGSQSSMMGVGGTDLSGLPTDQYGFPEWSGSGNSHAAGIFQFQPSTWDSLASTYGLNFSNTSDQEAGAWILAQQADPSLYSQLQSGDYGAVQGALSGIWPSVAGNGAAPQGLALDLASGTGAALPSATSSNSGGSAGPGTSGGTGPWSS